MSGFWRFWNLIFSLIGFLVTGGILLYKGESFANTVVRAVISFIVLYAVQNLFGTILVSIADFVPQGQVPALDESKTHEGN